MFRSAVRKATGRLLGQLRRMDAGDAASCVAAMQAAADTALLAGQTCAAIEALQQVGAPRCFSCRLNQSAKTSAGAVRRKVLCVCVLCVDSGLRLYGLELRVLFCVCSRVVRLLAVHSQSPESRL